jgi:hypothetical protein
VKAREAFRRRPQGQEQSRGVATQVYNAYGGGGKAPVDWRKVGINVGIGGAFLPFLSFECVVFV